MSRSLFLLISAILALGFGLMMFLLPPLAAQAFHLTASPATAAIFRVLGAVMIAVGLLNFLIRNHRDSATLAAVLWFNIATHGLGIIGDVYSAAVGDIPWAGVGPGIAAHLFVGLGALYFVRAMPKV